jgi:hypothetical protein
LLEAEILLDRDQTLFYTSLYPELQDAHVAFLSFTLDILPCRLDAELPRTF